MTVNSSSFDRIARSSVNSVWGALTMEVLARLGVQTVVVSPGSRSTPLTIAAASNAKLECVTLLDERSAAFFALGQAKQSGRPVALVCTSGSAAVNYAPAVVEASMSGVPLLLLTADRPPEMRQCSSGQTIDQLRLYGEFVRAFYELAIPEMEAELLQYLRQSLVHGVEACLSGNPGPVHFNFPFRDPLPPVMEGEPVIEASELEALATVVRRPAEAVLVASSFDLVAIERLRSHRHGLIVVGDLQLSEDASQDAVAALEQISQKLGWPILADVLNPLRHRGGQLTNLVASYDTFLRDADVAKELEPTAVLQVGTLPTSKVLRQWLKGVDAVAFLQSERPLNTDPLHRVATPLLGSLSDLEAALSAVESDAGWCAAWMELERGYAARIADVFCEMEAFFEGKVAWILSQHLPEKCVVSLASSMSVRYAEFFWQVSGRQRRVFANRGANGIDGTLSTAMGFAHRGVPTVLLTGDLAFLHDSNGLLCAQTLRGSLTVVLINNQGGGIFEHLPVSEQSETFEAYFATPQAVDFESLVRAHGLEYCLIEDWASLASAIEVLPDMGVRVFELKTDRKADVGLFRRLCREDLIQ